MSTQKRSVKRKLINGVKRNRQSLFFLRVTTSFSNSDRNITHFPFPSNSAEILNPLTFQVSQNATNWRITTKVSSISYWPSLAQVKMNGPLSLHLVCIHRNTKVRSMTFTDCDGQQHSVFASLISIVNPWLFVTDANRRQNVKLDPNAFKMLPYSYRYDKLSVLLLKKRSQR